MEKLILECVVRSTLLAAFTALALLVLRVKAARVRHAVWASVVVLMLALPAWTVWGPKAVFHVLTPAPVAADVQPVAVPMTIAVPVAPNMPAPRPEWTWLNSLFVAYLLGFGGLMARLITGTVRTRLLLRGAGNRNGRLTSDRCVTPITVGWLKPSVILPTGWRRWSHAQLTAVLAHEDEHARRRDPLVQWLALLNRAVFWFHPLAWWLERRLSGLAEEACDDAVLIRGHDPLQYSECLLGLARVVQESGARVAVVGMAMPGTFLPARIRRIVEGAKMQRISRGRLVSVVTVCALLAVSFMAGTLGYAAQTREAAVPVATVAPTMAPAISVAPSAEKSVPARPASIAAPVLLAQAVASPVPAVPAANSGSSGQSLSGVVTDPSGAVVANAIVAIAGENNAVVVYSDNVGRFRAENIDSGVYSISIKVPGFKTLTQTGITVSAGEAHNAGALPLVIGGMAESISVTGSRSAPVVVAAATVGNPLGPVTSIVPKASPPVGIPLDQKPNERMYAAALEKVSALVANLQKENSAKPTRVGGMVQAVKLLTVVKPVYPPELQRAGVEGTVKFEAVISKDGLPLNIKLINGPGGLTQAALDAVSQWRYSPSTLNGEPIEVLTVIDVNFSLAN